jgi:hypothetical protein
MSKYKLSQDEKIIYTTRKDANENTVLVQIPVDADNSDYKAYLEWLDAGNIPDPADPPLPPDPQDVSDRALYTDMLSRYQEAIAQLQAVEQDITTITGHAIALSTVVVSGTNAQMQTILRTLGTDMNTLAQDVKTITVGNEQLLKVVGTYIKSHL